MRLLLDQGSPSLGSSVKLGSCLSMDGRRHENGQSWHDGCRECYCHDGREMCALISCPVPNCDNPSIRASQCCPSCPGLNLHLLTFYDIMYVLFYCCGVSHKQACMTMTFLDLWLPLKGLIVSKDQQNTQTIDPTEWHSRVSTAINLKIKQCECFSNQL